MCVALAITGNQTDIAIHTYGVAQASKHIHIYRRGWLAKSLGIRGITARTIGPNDARDVSGGTCDVIFRIVDEKLEALTRKKAQ
jgi:hypothetical protein